MKYRNDFARRRNTVPGWNNVTRVTQANQGRWPKQQEAEKPCCIQRRLFHSCDSA